MRFLTSLLLLLACLSAPALTQDDDAQIKQETLLVYSKLMGNEKAARTLIDDLSRMADDYGLNFKTVIGAATKAINQSIKPARIPGLLAVSIDTAVGVQADDLERARTFLVMAEQLGELLRRADDDHLYRALTALDLVGVPIWAILSDSIGVSERETRRLALQRGFAPQETAELLIKECQKKYGGLAKKLAESRRK